MINSEKEYNDWYIKLCDDSNFNSKVIFDRQKFLSLLESSVEDLEHLKPYEFFACIFELTRAFSALSSALSLGFSDITSKVNNWRNLFKTFYKDNKDIQSVMEEEIKLNIHELNSENNKSLGHKKGTTYYKYESGTRTLLILSWFINFVGLAFKNLLDTEDGFNVCIKKAYDVALGPYHGWMIRKGASIALSFAPSKRGKVLNLFFGKLSFYKKFI